MASCWAFTETGDGDLECSKTSISIVDRPRFYGYFPVSGSLASPANNRMVTEQDGFYVDSIEVS